MRVCAILRLLGDEKSALPREFVLTTLEGAGLKAVDLFSLSSPFIAPAMLIVMAVIGLKGRARGILRLLPHYVAL
jgi:hypothetical protein